MFNTSRVQYLSEKRQDKLLLIMASQMVALFFFSLLLELLVTEADSVSFNCRNCGKKDKQAEVKEQFPYLLA